MDCYVVIFQLQTSWSYQLMTSKDKIPNSMPLRHIGDTVSAHGEEFVIKVSKRKAVHTTISLLISTLKTPASQKSSSSSS